MRRFSPLLALFLFLFSMPLLAVTRTWTGTNNGSWINAGNWGGAAPVAGDDLVFPAGASNLTNTNDFPAGTSFHSMSFSGPYSIGGNAVVIGAGGITSSSNAVTIALPLQLGASQTWSNSGTAVAMQLTITGAVQLNGFTLTLSGGAFPSWAFINGPISGAASIVKTGANVWWFGGANTYSGQTVVNAGYVIAVTSNALGIGDDTLANGTIVNNGGALLIDGVTLAPEYIRLFGNGPSCCGALKANGGDLTLTGTVELASPDVTITAEFETVTFNGKLTGIGPLVMSSEGAFVLMNPANDFAGQVNGIGPVILRLGADNVIPTGKAVNPGHVLDVNGKTQTIASLVTDGFGFVRMGSGGHLTISGPGTTTFVGNFVQTGTVTQTGGQLTLTQHSDFLGAWNNNGGELRLVGGSFVVPFTQTAGAFALASNGSAGTVTINGGTFAPGRGGTGIGNSGNLTLAPGAIYSEPITSAGAFGNIHASGAVTLGGSALSLTGAATGVQIGNQFTLIDNDGVDPVAGTFAGLPPNATIMGGPGNFNYTISYTGGTGNDVVLTASSAPTSTVISSSVNPIGLGLSVTLTATVTPLAGNGTPTGTVTFFDGATSLGSGTLSGGTATLTSALTFGGHTITAVYAGDAADTGSTSAPFVETVVAGIPALDPRAVLALGVVLAMIAIVTMRR